MIELKISNAAAMIRERLLAHADVHESASLASRIANLSVDTLNESGVDVSTHIVAQALVARAVVDIASKWLSDITGVPVPETHQALLSIVVNLPAEISPVVYDTRKGEPG